MFLKTILFSLCFFHASWPLQADLSSRNSLKSPSPNLSSHIRLGFPSLSLSPQLVIHKIQKKKKKKSAKAELSLHVGWGKETERTKPKYSLKQGRGKGQQHSYINAFAPSQIPVGIRQETTSAVTLLCPLSVNNRETFTGQYHENLCSY